MIEISTVPEYERDLKKPFKRYIYLYEDMDEMKAILRKKPDARPPFSSWIEGLGISTCMIKVKKIACRALKGRRVNSGFRLVYAWLEEEEKTIFVEL